MANLWHLSSRTLPGVILTALILYVATAGGSLTSTDAVLTHDLSRQLLAGSIALSPEMATRSAYAVPGVDGRLYSPWGIGQALFATSFVWTASRLESLPPFARLPANMLSKALFALSSALAAALAVGLCYTLGLAGGATQRHAAGGAGLLAVGTPLWPYAGFGFNTALAAAVVLLAIGAAWMAEQSAARRDFVVAGGCLAVAWSVRHEFLLLVLVVAIWLLANAARNMRERIMQVAWLAAGLLPIALLLSVYNQVRFGAPLNTGYSPEFDFSGFLGLAFSPAASVLLYFPAVPLVLMALVRLPPRLRRLRWLLVGSTAALWLLYGSMANWMGGRSYGPRYLVPLIALLCFAVGPVLATSTPRWRRVLGVIVLLSVLVQIPGVAINYAVAFDDWAEAHPGQPAVGARVWERSGSALAVTSAALLRTDPGAPPADFWWLHLAELGIVSPGFAWLIGTALFLALGLVGFATWRRLDVPS